MIRFYFVVLPFLLVGYLKAQDTPNGQNLIPNPGFEESHFRLTSFTDRGQVFGKAMVDWHTPNKASTDLISPVFLGRKLRHPVTFHGGEQMVGLSIHIPAWGEYVSVELKEPLEPGLRYYGEFWFFLSVSFEYGEQPQPFNRYFGMAFDRKIEEYSSNLMLNRLPDIFAPDTLMIQEGQWMKISGTFQARKASTHLHLGQFLDPALPHSLLNGYFFLDDVFVCRLDETSSPVKNYSFSEHEKTGEPITLDRVFFDFNAASLQEESFDQLNTVARWLQEHPEFTVTIQGHTDDVGKDAYNFDLSSRRAQAVVDFLESAGVPSTRLHAVGMGETQPIVPNISEENRQRNRRVEMVFD